MVLRQKGPMVVYEATLPLIGRDGRCHRPIGATLHTRRSMDGRTLGDEVSPIASGGDRR
ncbi:MAG: hypothetical protein JXA22_06620 [Candidatus Thermoplasmatota archaeon]|nr:hypothetical protein [Candidatus Thermoplasmatota archaeon]